MPLLPQTGLRIVARLMNRARRGFRRPGSFSWTVVGSVLVVAALGAGCDQISARRHIQAGTNLYEDEKYEDAAKEFEAGLQIDPDLDIGQYNLGLTYWKMFRPGDAEPANKAYADKAVEHFQRWLKDNPHDTETQELVSELWVNNEEFDKALSFWEHEHEARPQDTDPLNQLATINFKAGKFEQTVHWYGVLADAEPKVKDKVDAYIAIGRFAYVRLSDPKTVGEERIHVADLGAQGLQKAAEIDPKNIEAENLQGAIYNYRALAQGPYWAVAVDRAIALHHQSRGRVLRAEAKKAQDQTAPTPPSDPAGGAARAGG
jgi:tetratricopeptide (TPR) repeat protein